MVTTFALATWLALQGGTPAIPPRDSVVEGCPASSPATDERQYAAADVVFAGRVVRTDTVVQDGLKTGETARRDTLYRVTLRDRRAWKGAPTRSQVVEAPRRGDPLAVPFEIGKEYVVFASAYHLVDQPGRIVSSYGPGMPIQTTRCAGTRRASSRDSIFRALEGIRQARSRRRSSKP